MCFKVYLALEAGYFEKVDELCNRYSLAGFLNIKGIPYIQYSLDHLDVSLCMSGRFLQLCQNQYLIFDY